MLIWGEKYLRNSRNLRENENKLVYLHKIIVMKTLTLHINDSIYNKVKSFLSLIPPEKIRIEDNTELNAVLTNNYFSNKEFEKILILLKKFNIPIPTNSEKQSLTYNENDLDLDVSNLKKLKLLK